MARASFTYSESSEILFCRRCGQIAGRPTKCTHGYTSHDFVKTQKMVVCARCGAAIGEASDCTGGYTAHDFRSIE